MTRLERQLNDDFRAATAVVRAAYRDLKKSETAGAAYASAFANPYGDDIITGREALETALRSLGAIAARAISAGHGARYITSRLDGVAKYGYSENYGKYGVIPTLRGVCYDVWFVDVG